MILNITEYEKGLLLGDGTISQKDDYRLVFFCTTHKEIADKIESMYARNGIKFSRFNRDHAETKDKERYEILEIIECYNKEFLSFYEDMIQNHELNMDLIAGILETKGTFFSYLEKRNNKEITRWRISFSGSESYMKKIQTFLENQSIYTSPTIIHRKERLSQGVISSSFRLYINKFESVHSFIKGINSEYVSAALKEKIEDFIKFYKDSKRIEPRIYKNYKTAILTMLKTLGLKAKGERNKSGTKGYAKEINLYNESNTRIKVLGYGWEEAYVEVCALYKEQTGFEPHIVKEENENTFINSKTE